MVTLPIIWRQSKNCLLFVIGDNSSESHCFELITICSDERRIGKENNCSQKMWPLCRKKKQKLFFQKNNLRNATMTLAPTSWNAFKTVRLNDKICKKKQFDDNQMCKTNFLLHSQIASAL